MSSLFSLLAATFNRFDRSFAVGLSFVAAACLFIVGCGGGSDGPDTHPVTGLVTLDGEPVADATVTFSGGTPQTTSFGKSDADGRYTLKTASMQNGTVIGTHRVTVTKTERPDAASDPANNSPGFDETYDPAAASNNQPLPEDKSLIPEKYAARATSELTAEIVEGENTVDLALTSE